MLAAECVACSAVVPVCTLCGGPADLHEHVYGEGWCTRCWTAFLDRNPADSQDADCYRVERTSGG